MIQTHNGRAEDRLELFFQDVQLQSQFMITRPLQVIVGSQADHDMLKPKVPYVPRKRTERQPETDVVEGEAPPSLKAIPYIGKLPQSHIPNHLSISLSAGSTREVILRLQRVFLPSIINSETYAKHFKHLVWTEEFQMEWVIFCLPSKTLLMRYAVAIWNIMISPMLNSHDITAITSKLYISHLAELVHIHTSILSLEVPGLAEKRPSVLVG